MIYAVNLTGQSIGRQGPRNQGHALFFFAGAAGGNIYITFVFSLSLHRERFAALGRRAEMEDGFVFVDQAFFFLEQTDVEERYKI